VIAVVTASSLYTQNSYPATGTGTDTVQVFVQIAIAFGPTSVGVALGVIIGTTGRSAATIAAGEYNPAVAVAWSTWVTVVLVGDRTTVAPVFVPISGIVTILPAALVPVSSMLLVAALPINTPENGNSAEPTVAPPAVAACRSVVITGVVSTGLVIVCTPIKVFAASVLAMVAEVDGKV
jgi:hypothetical protein